MKVIIFTMKNGQMVDFATLTGWKNPVEGKKVTLEQTAQVAMQVDDQIESYEIVERDDI
jgi:hypothetical protein